jgi:hypothetical protein
MKGWARYSNGHRIDYDLMRRHNVALTYRLLQAGAFEDTDPELTAIIRKLHDTCPFLFKRIIPAEDTAEEDNKGDDYGVAGDANHLNPKASFCLKAQFVREHMDLPTNFRQLNVSHPFTSLLIQAYGEEYSCRHIFDLGRAGVKWYKTISYDDP